MDRMSLAQAWAELKETVIVYYYLIRAYLGL